MSAPITSAPASAAWHVDPSHVEAGFAVRHLMISTVKGRFSGISGRVTVTGDDFATASVEATIDVNTIDTREPKRDEHLRSADFFDVARFPTMTFRSRRVDRSTKNHYRLIGDLTIRDVTREVVFDVMGEGLVRDPWGSERAGFSATAVLNRKDFGLTWNVALETGGVLVGDDVKLSIDVELVRQVTSQAA